MPDYKKQHFIPQFYFRFFSWNNKDIGMFNENNGKYYRSVFIKGQCQKDYFYGTDGNIEKILTDIEDKSIPALKELIKTQICKSHDNIFLNILPFVIVQFSRTQYLSDFIDDSNSKLLKDYTKENLKYSKLNIKTEDLDDIKIKIENAPIIALQYSIISLPLFFDLKAKLFINSTPINFLFSDNPVILYNSLFYDKYFSNTGYGNRGLQIFYPISPKLLLIFYDDYIYKIGETNRNEIIINNVQDVNKLNELQFLSANECIYFDNSFNEDKLLTYWDSVKKYKKSEKSNFIKSKKIKDRDKTRQLVATSKNDISYRIDLSIIKIYSRALSCEANSYRNPQLMIEVSNFIDEVYKGNYGPNDLFKFVMQKYYKK